MAHTLKIDQRDGYVFDPMIKGYATDFWKTLTGTPAMSSNVLRFTSAKAESYIQHIFGEYEFLLNVPVKPTAGDSRQWGLMNPSSTNFGAIYFDISATVFSLKSYDDNGTLTTTVLNWADATFSAHAIKFKFRWEPDQIIAYVNDVKVATINQSSPSNALGLYINNGVADNMDLSYILVHKAAAIV